MDACFGADVTPAGRMLRECTHNMAPISMSVEQEAKLLIRDGKMDETILNKVEMAVRAYDP